MNFAIYRRNVALSIVDIYDNTAVRCDINSSSGELSNCATTGSGFADPAEIAINPAGTYAYITNTGSGGGVSVCAITAVTGDLTACTMSGGVVFPIGVAINSAGTRAYLTSPSAGSILLCAIRVC